MESGCSKNVESTRPQLLDLIPQEKEWLHVKRGDGFAEEKNIELRLGLGPPGEDNCYFPSSMKSNGSVLSAPWGKNHHHHHHQQQQQQQQTKASSFLQFPSTNSLPVMAKESSQAFCNNTAVDLQDAERKAFKPSANTAVPLNTSQKRTAPGPVVGWPPIRSIRKNLASNSSSKLASEPQSVDPPHKVANEKPATEPNGKTLFVKVNMDGVPIGRKVDLKAHDSYEKLSTAVDELFRGLLAAQRDSSAGGTVNKQEGEGILDGSGEYTLVYEDNEGDNMLVGDVPWHMFVSTVKRLRALKTSELSALGLGNIKQGKMKA